MLGPMSADAELITYWGSAAPMASAPSWAPSNEYWLKPRSSIVPTSVTSPILRSELGAAPPGLPDASGLWALAVPTTTMLAVASAAASGASLDLRMYVPPLSRDALVARAVDAVAAPDPPHGR